MSWEDRLKEAAYTTPSGVRFTWLYESVKSSVTRRTPAFEFPDVEGTLIQDLGRSGRRYPLRIFFSGPDYDLEASAFEAALIEQGVGLLEHPVYGEFNVVPFGDTTRRDDLVRAANQAVIEVVFFETLTEIYPSSQLDPTADTIAAVEAYNLAAAETFEANAGLEKTINAATFKNKMNVALNSIERAVRPIVDLQEDVQRQYDAINDSISRGLDILLTKPGALALQTIQLIQAPARTIETVGARAAAFRSLLDQLFSAEPTPSTPEDLAQADIFASSYVSAEVVTAINTPYLSRPQALRAAEAVAEQFDTLTTWRDNGFGTAGAVDTGESYQALQRAVATVSGALVQISFTLRQERRIILDRDRSLVELVAELYGSVDDQLDFFINSNSLTASEILTIPRGRQIVYYV